MFVGFLTTYMQSKGEHFFSPQLRILMESWKKLKDDHEELKKKEKEMKLEVEIYNEEKISVLKKSAVQTKVI